jgi:hypothetical protein
MGSHGVVAKHTRMMFSFPVVWLLSYWFALKRTLTLFVPSVCI